MVICDVYYRLKGSTKNPVSKKSFTGATKESVRLMAQGVLGKDYTIIKIEKVG